MPRKAAAKTAATIAPAGAEDEAKAIADMERDMPAELKAINTASMVAAPHDAGADIQYRELPLGRVSPSPLNPRRSRSQESIESLSRSIVDKGVLQPILVRPDPQLDIEGEHFEIIFGEGRWRAAALAVADGRLPAEFAIPARVRDCTDDELVILAAIENLDREDMEPLDEAELYAALRPRVTPADGETREAAIGRLVHVSERTVFRRLALLRAIPEVREKLREGELDLGQVQAFALAGEDRQREILAQPEDYDAGEIRHLALQSRVTLDRAVFDLKLYEGEIVDDTVTGQRFFADQAQFDRLQLAELEARAEKLRGRKKWGWVEVIAPDSDRSFWQDYAAQDPSTYEEYKPGDPDAGAVVLIERYSRPAKITVKAPVLRKADADARVKARRAANSAPNGDGAAEADAARDPLSKTQQAQLHAAKTRTLRRMVAADDALAMALAVLGLLGAGEVRLGGEGLPIGPLAENRIDSPPENLTAIDELLDLARGIAHPRDKKLLAGDWRSRGLDPQADTARAWLDALMELPGAELRRLFALLVAERVGSWYLPDNQGWRGRAEVGDTPLAEAIAGWPVEEGSPQSRQVDPADWAPVIAAGREFFKGYPKDRLLDLARLAAVKTGQQHNLAGIRKGELVDLVAAQPPDTWTPDLFPECRFQSEEAARKAVAGGGVPLAALYPHHAEAAPAEAPKADPDWEELRPLLAAGGELKRDGKTKRYYVDGNGSFADAQVRRLEGKGLIRRVGVDTYAIAAIAGLTPEPEPAAEEAASRHGAEERRIGQVWHGLTARPKRRHDDAPRAPAGEPAEAEASA
jgi:ParB/RepB/Spo0J family partition protein